MIDIACALIVVAGLVLGLELGERRCKQILKERSF